MNECGVTVREIQEYLDLESPQAIYKWLNGRALPAPDNLLFLGRMLHVPMEELLVLENDWDPEKEENWNKKHPPVLVAYRLWIDENVREADAKRFKVFIDMMQDERKRVARTAH